MGWKMDAVGLGALALKAHLGSRGCEEGFSEGFGSLCRPSLWLWGPWDSVRAQTGLLEFPRDRKRPASQSEGAGVKQELSLSRILEKGGSQLRARVWGPELSSDSNFFFLDV